MDTKENQTLTNQKGDIPMTAEITIESKAFGNNQTIPRKYSAEGENCSPPLAWSAIPDGTKEMALIMDDPDAPTAEPWVHWVIYNITAEGAGLPENVSKQEKPANPPGAKQGVNTGGQIGYYGPLPPKGHGVHHYHFKIYALKESLDLKPGIDKKTLLHAMSNKIIGEGDLIGTYERK